MHIDVQSRGFTRSRSLSAYAQRRLHFALANALEQVSRVVVRLTDFNGPAKERRDELGMCCRIHVSLDGAAPVLIEDTETEIYRAIDRAADRAGRTVRRRLVRHGVFPNGLRDSPASRHDARES